MNADEFLALVEQRRKEGFEKVELIAGKGDHKEVLHVLDISESIKFKKIIIYWNTKNEIPRGQINADGIIEIKGQDDKKQNSKQV